MQVREEQINILISRLVDSYRRYHDLNFTLRVRNSIELSDAKGTLEIGNNAEEISLLNEVGIKSLRKDVFYEVSGDEQNPIFYARVTLYDMTFEEADDCVNRMRQLGVEAIFRAMNVTTSRLRTQALSKVIRGGTLSTVDGSVNIGLYNGIISERIGGMNLKEYNYNSGIHVVRGLKFTELQITLAHLIMDRVGFSTLEESFPLIQE